jgi:hypothetical protein
MLEGRSFVRVHRPQATSRGAGAAFGSVVCSATATAVFHCRIRPQHQAHRRPIKCGGDALSRPAAAPLPTTLQQFPQAVVAAANGGPGEAGTGSTWVKGPTGPRCPPAYAGPPASPPPVDMVTLATAQASCPDCQKATSSSLWVAVIQMQGVAIMVDTSSGIFRPLVPASFRRPIFDAIHSLAHPGIRATRRLITSRFVWPCLASQVAA